MNKIKGLENSGYLISDDLKIYSLKRKRFLKPTISSAGYYIICLRVEKKRISKLMHRIIAETFLENKDNLPVVNHKDFNRLNNSLDNLEWVTHKGNSDHARDNGRFKITEKSLAAGKKVGLSRRKVSMEVANKIREEYKNGVFQRNLSLKYGVARSAISAIVNGKTYNG